MREIPRMTRARDAAGERALRWRRGERATHHRVDDGEAAPGQNRTPVAQPEARRTDGAPAVACESRGAGIGPRWYRRVLCVVQALAERRAGRDGR